MKIYINHLNLDALPELLKSLNNKYINSETYIQIYSSDGIYETNNSSSKKLMPIDSDIQILENYHENFTLLVDTSYYVCLLYTSPSPRDRQKSRMPSSA